MLLTLRIDSSSMRASPARTDTPMARYLHDMPCIQSAYARNNPDHKDPT